MKISFFEIQDWEIPILKKALQGNILQFSKKPLTLANVKDCIDSDAVSVFIYSKIDKEIISKLPNLKFITTRSMGFDHIDLESCRKAKIKVATAPHYGDQQKFGNL